MFRFRYLQPRVSTKTKLGSELVVRIARQNDSRGYVVMLIGFTVLFLLFLACIIRPILRQPFSSSAAYLAPFFAFAMIWYIAALRITLWRGFGVEELSVEHGTLHWTRTALFWVRKCEIPTKDITSVNPVTPWHRLNNRVELTALGKRRSIGNMLLKDEATELARRLRKAVGVSE